MAFHLDGVIRLIRVPGQLTLTEGGSDDCGDSGTRGDRSDDGRCSFDIDKVE